MRKVATLFILVGTLAACTSRPLMSPDAATEDGGLPDGFVPDGASDGMVPLDANIDANKDSGHPVDATVVDLSTPPDLLPPPDMVQPLDMAGQDMTVLPIFNNAISANVGADNLSAIANGNFDDLDDVASPHLDLVVASSTGNAIYLLKGNGNGTFQAAVSTAVATSPRAIVAHDFNGDNHLDLAVACNSGGVSVLLNNGHGVFTRTDYAATLSGMRGITTGKINGDDFFDLVIARTDNTAVVPNGVSILLGQASGAFEATPSINLATGAKPTSVVLGNFKAATPKDIATANYLGNNMSVLLVAAGGGYDTHVDYSAGSYPFSLVTTNLRSPSNTTLDLIAANWGPPGSNGTLSVRLGNGNGTFGAETTYDVGHTGPEGLVAYDFNADGHKDIAVVSDGTAGSPSNVTVFLGTGSGALTSPTDYPVGIGPTRLVVGDYNEDTKPDLAVANSSGNIVSILLHR